MMTSRLPDILAIALTLLLLVGAAPMGASAPLPPNPGGNPSSAPMGASAPLPPNSGGNPSPAVPGGNQTPPDVGGPGGPAITLRVQTPVYMLDATGLIVPDYATHSTPGAPSLPVWATTVELPATGGWTISFDAGAAITLTAPAALPVVPVPDYTSLRGPSVGPTQSLTSQEIASGHTPSLAMTESDAADFLPALDRPDPTIYAADAFYPAAPVQAEELGWQAGRRLLAVRVFPFQYNPVRGELRYYPDIRVTVLDHGDAKSREEHEARSDDSASSRSAAFAALRGFALQTPLQSPTGSLRLRTGERGLHRLTWADLVAAGVPVTTTDPTTFAMSYLGQPIDIQVTGEADGHFDPDDLVIFYAEPYVGRYMTQNVYWFTWSGADGGRMATRGVAPIGAEPLVTTITQTLHLEYNRDYRPLYNRPRDADHWFDTQLYPNAAAPTATVPYTLTLDDPLRTGDLRLTAVFFGGEGQSANPDQSVALRLNAHPVGTYQWDGSTAYTATATIPAAWLDASPDRLYLEAALSQLPGLSYYWVSPDWVEVSYAAQADAENDRIYIEAVAAGPKEIAVSGFTTDTIKVYDVADARHPVQVTTVTAQVRAGVEAVDKPPLGSSGLSPASASPAKASNPEAGQVVTYTFHFWDSTAADPAYYLAADASLLTPLAIEPVTPSTWGTTAHRADYIAIVHRSLWDAIQPLLDHRTDEELAVAKVDVQDIYDEFSYGRRDPEAIRSFLGYAYRNWQRPAPQYVLLVGDGHYDFTGVSGTTLLNLVPPYLVNVDSVQGETPADNRFVSVDGPDDYLPEMSVGRISAQTAADVTAVVAKIIAYETTAPAGDWQRRTVFVADNCMDPAGDFHAASEDIRTGLLPTGYTSQTIYYGSLTDCPAATHDTVDGIHDAVMAAFNADAFMLQWVGHASRVRWGSVKSPTTGVSMFRNTDVPNLNANDAWPLTFSYSCISGYFVNIDGNLQSLGETLVNAPGRGAVADLSPAGFHILPVLEELNRTVVKAIFQDRIGRMGPAVDAAKLAFLAGDGQSDLVDTYILFGDPALKLRLPPLPTTPTFLPLIETAKLKLTWTHLPENTSYEVWRGDQPYVALGSAASVRLVELSAPVGGGAMTYTDNKSNSVGDASRNYFYTVRGANPLGVSATPQWAGEFDFGLTPGQ